MKWTSLASVLLDTWRSFSHRRQHFFSFWHFAKSWLASVRLDSIQFRFCAKRGCRPFATWPWSLDLFELVVCFRLFCIWLGRLICQLVWTRSAPFDVLDNRCSWAFLLQDRKCFPCVVSRAGFSNIIWLYLRISLQCPVPWLLENSTFIWLFRFFLFDRIVVILANVVC